MAKISGHVITSEDMDYFDCQDIAFDPETGVALIPIKIYRSWPPPQAYSYIFEDGKIGPRVKMYDFDGAILVEPAGDGRFLALGVWWDRASTYFIYYLEYRDGMWSAPLELSRLSMKSYDYWSGDILFLSDLDRRA